MGREDRLGPPVFPIVELSRRDILRSMESKSRKWLRHDIPSWVKREDEVYFITICSRERHNSYLAPSRIAAGLLASIRFKRDQQIWFPVVALVMPDHIHMILRLGVESKGLSKEIKNWKSWTAKNLGISWQNGFFDHRLRGADSLSQKYEYILENPVRAGLVDNAIEWKWKIVSED